MLVLKILVFVSDGFVIDLLGLIVLADGPIEDQTNSSGNQYILDMLDISCNFVCAELCGIPQPHMQTCLKY